MLLAKIWYFFYFGGMVCVLPYLNLLYRSNGLNDAQIGVLAAVKPWVSAPSSFVWSGLADRFSAHKLIMITTFVVSTLARTGVSLAHSFAAFLVLAVLGEFLAAPVGVMADAAVVAACKQDTDYGKSRLWGAVAWGSLSAVSGAMVSHFGMPAGFLAYAVLSVPCVFCAWHMEVKLGTQHHTAADKPAQQQQQQQHLVKNQQQQQQQMPMKGKELQQWRGREPHDANDAPLGTDIEQQHLLGCQQARAQAAHGLGGGTSPSTPRAPAEGQVQQQQQLQQQGLGDSTGSTEDDACVLVVDKDSNHLQGCARGGTVQSSGRQEQQQQHTKQQHADQQEVLLQQDLASQTAATGGQQDTAPQQQKQQQQLQQQQEAPVEFWQGLKQLLSRPAVLIFMWQATVMGFGIGVIGEFLFLFIQDLGGSETLMGLTLTMTCVAEVPVFHYQGHILKHISVHNMLHVVMWTYVLRLGLYALLPHMGSAWAVLPIELLHGVTFGCGWSAGTITSKRVAPPGLAATMQGIFQGLYFGVGQGLGALVGGLLKEKHGGQAMFAMCSGIVLVGWLLCVLAEQATADGPAAHAAAAEEGSSSNGCCEMQQRQQQQQWQQQHYRLSGSSWSWLRRWLGAAVARLLAGGSKLDAVAGAGNNASAAAARGRWQHKYAELASKDSGPDLTDIAAVGDRCQGVVFGV